VLSKDTHISRCSTKSTYIYLHHNVRLVNFLYCRCILGVCLSSIGFALLVSSFIHFYKQALVLCNPLTIFILFYVQLALP
jgi:hypothetical protein